MGSIGFLNKRAAYRKPIALFMVFAMILGFIPVLPAYATDPEPPAFLEVHVNPSMVTTTQDVTITVESSETLAGPPMVELTKPNSSTETVEVTETTPGSNMWVGLYHVHVDTMTLEGTYTVSAMGDNGSYPDMDEAYFTVDLPDGPPPGPDGPGDLAINISESTVTVSQDVTITVSYNQEFTGMPWLKVRRPGESTETTISVMPTGPSVWTGIYHISPFDPNGWYDVTASLVDGEEVTETAGFLVDLSGGSNPGPGGGPGDPGGPGPGQDFGGDSIIKGKVYGPAGEQGGALLGCEVRLYNQEFYAPPMTWSTTTGTAGEYEFTTLPPGDYWVEANPSDDTTNLAASQKVMVTIESPETTCTQNLTLRIPSMTGKVVNPDGSAAANVRVEARTQDWNKQLESFTNSQGRFALPPVDSPNTYIVTAYASPESNYVNSEQKPFTLGNAVINLPDSNPLSLRYALITGQILSPQNTTDSVSGVGVMIHDQNWTVQEHASTDANGYYRFGQINAGTYIIEAFPSPESPYSQASPTVVSINGSSQTMPPIKLTYPSITGKVYNPNPPGGTAEGAFVQVHNANWSVNVGSGTGSDGSFRIGGLAPGTYTIEAMPSPGSPYSKSAANPITITEGTTQTVNLYLTKPMIVGWLYDADGKPVTNAGVGLHTPDWTTAIFAPVGEGGRFSLGGVDTGTYELELNPPWDRPDLIRPTEPLTINVISETSFTAPGAEWITIDGTTGIKASFAKASKTITGTVTKNGGSPVTNARVFAFMERGGGFASGTTDNQGKYSLGVSGGQWMVSIEPNYEASSTIDWAYTGQPKRVSFATDTVPETQTAVDFQVVTANAAVTGKIVAPDGVTGVQMAHVEVRNSSGQGNSGSPDMNGNFSINVPAGTYQVMVFLGPESPYGSPPAKTVTVNDTGTVNVGDLTLTQKNSQIKGIVTDAYGKVISSAKVVAWQMSGGFAQSTTGSDGTFTLNVSPGNWEVMLEPTKDASYVYSGPPKRVTVEANQVKSGVSFSVVYADATIKGRVIKVSGTTTETISDLYGFAVAMTTGEGEHEGYGAPLESGQFEIKVPAGTYDISGGLPPGAPYMLNGKEDVAVISGETKIVELTVVENNRKIFGTIRDQLGNPITDDNLFLEVFAINNSGSLQHTLAEKDQGSGQWKYELKVTDGQWRIGYFANPDSGYIGRPPMDENSAINVATDTDTAYNITLYKASAVITGKVTGADGVIGIPNAFVFAEETATANGGRNKFFADTKTDADGNYTLNVPAGGYRVGAGMPPSKMKEQSLIHPTPIEVTVANDSTSTVNLQFSSASATISGTAKVGTTGVPALVWAWSDGGGYAEVDAESDGSFSMPVKGGDTWHVGASYENESGFYEAAEQSVSLGVSATASVTLDLTVSSVIIPDAVSVTFAANQMKVIDLSDGTKIEIPANALATSGNVTVIAKPITGLRKQKDSVPVGLGYELSAMNSSGQTISEFKSSVTITFPYDPTKLPAGVTVNDLVPAYWDNTSGTWKAASSVVVDTTKKTITIMVDHFSVWGNVAKDVDQTPPATPTGLLATAGDGQVALSWNANSDSDLAGYNLYRNGSKVNTSLITTTSYTDTGRTNGTSYSYQISAVDDSSNESTKSTAVFATPAGTSVLAGGPGVDLTAPAKPAGLTATAGKDQIALSWSANSEPDLTGYNLYRAAVDDVANATKLTALAKDKTSYTDTTVVAGTTYYYWLSGYDTAGNESTKAGSVSAKVNLAEEPVKLKDIDASHWAHSYVQKLVSKKIISGYKDGSFRPMAKVTRAEFAKMVCIAMGWELTDPVTPSFSDVAKGGWAYKYIETAKAHGVLTGYDDGSFRPGQKITRAEIAKVIAEALSLSTSPSTLKDINASWAKNYINACVKAGIVEGYSGNLFKPGNNASRAEAAKMISGLIK